jgi:hypothetical protein
VYAPEEFEARLREVAALAPTLVGLGLDVAVERARERGSRGGDLPDSGEVAIPVSLV